MEIEITSLLKRDLKKYKHEIDKLLELEKSSNIFGLTGKFLKRTDHTSFPETIRDVWNVIFNMISFSFGLIQQNQLSSY